MENYSPETAYLTKTNVGPLFTNANIVNMEHTLHDALPATAKAQALTKDDLEHTAKETRARVHLTQTNGGATITAGSIAKGK
jgi:hypothetical protein